VFFPPAYVERKDQKEEREQRAKAICATCPVREACLEFALTNREHDGVWGGATERERRRIVRQRRKSA
jgi:WhiB family redox-sensing transcriptional regulator